VKVLRLISKNMLIEDLVILHPHIVGPLKKEGIVCMACGEAVWGTLEQQANERGITNLDEIINRMNNLLDD
jgi:hypothetical protein